MTSAWQVRNGVHGTLGDAGFAGVLAVVITSSLTGGCAGAREPEVYSLEKFDTATYHAKTFETSAAQTCEAARRALLSHGYLVQRLNPEAVEGRKSFQPSDDIHVEIEFHVVCAPKLSNGSRVFVSALEDRYIVSRTSGSASLGVGPLGSLSLPIRSTTGSLVKTSSETIRVVDLYHRFFALIEHELAQLETDPTQDPAHAILPPPVTAPSPAEPISAPPCEYSPQLEKNEPGAGAVSCPVK